MTTNLTSMKEYGLIDRLGRLALWKILAFLFLWQFIPSLQGLTLHDEGFYAVFYQQIFNDPESVQFNFMYWFSGVVGAAWFKLFPNGGLLGLRIGGILVTLATLVLVYRMLKAHFSRGYIYLGLVLAVMALNNEPKELHYNNLSGLFYVAAAFFLYNGLLQRSYWQFAVAGFILAFNMFTRIPNLLGIALVTLVVIHGFLAKTHWKKVVIQSALLTGSFAAMVAFIIVIMKALGHWEVFLNAGELLSRMGKSQKGLYNVWTLVGIFFKNYFVSIRNILASLLILALITGKGRFLLPAGIRIAFTRWMLPVRVLVLATLVFIIIFRYIDGFTLLYLQSGFCVLSAVALLYLRRDPHLITLTLLGLFIMMVYPLGSNDGILTAGMYAFWLLFPIAVAFWAQLGASGVELNIEDTAEPQSHRFRLSIDRAQVAAINRTGVCLFVLMCVVNLYFYPHFDKKNRITMTHAVDHKFLRGIFTTPGRASAVSDALNELLKYTRKDDYLLAYDCVPMFNYLTETRPYVRNPWPWLYEADIFREELENAVNEKKPLPPVLVQEMITMNEGGYWPSDKAVYNTATWPVNAERNEALDQFLRDHQYREVWSSEFFRIYLPPSIP